MVVQFRRRDLHRWEYAIWSYGHSPDRMRWAPSVVRTAPPQSYATPPTRGSTKSFLMLKPKNSCQRALQTAL